MRRQAGFFDVDDRLKRLSDLGDQLELRWNSRRFLWIGATFWARTGPPRL